MKNYYCIVLFCCISMAVPAQTISIVSTGETGSAGTGWSLSGNTLTVTANASVHASVIETALSTGSLSVIALNISVDQHITSTTAHTLTLKAAGAVTIQPNRTIQTNGGDVIVWADADNSQGSTAAASDEILIDQGSSIITQGGDIIFAGGLDDGANGGTSGDGIPDNYAYRGTANSRGGVNLGPSASGYGYGTVVSLLSNGGNIIIRGRSASSTSGTRPGIVSQQKLLINSGDGRIDLQGISSVDHGIEFTYGKEPNIAITSSYSGSEPAIRIAGGTSLSGSRGLLLFNYVSGNFLIQSSATTGGGILLEGSATSSGNDAIKLTEEESNANIQLLSGNGSITLTTATVGTVTNALGNIYCTGVVRFGSRLNTTPIQGITPAVTSSNANVLIRGNAVIFNSGSTAPNVAATTGTFTIEPRTADNSFTFASTIRNLDLSTTSAFTVGKPGNTQTINLSAAVSVAGPVSMYGGVITLNQNLTSSASGDIFLKSLSSSNNCILNNATITKSGGTGTLTFQGNARVNNSGSITTSGTGVLNVVMWSDYDNTNNDGGVSQLGTISTNGGHVWLGGSNTNGGTYTWNGLNVGDGPSIGTAGRNVYGLEIYGNVTTNGGDFLAWAGTGSTGTANGIYNDGSGDIVNVGSGNIVLITDAFKGSLGYALYFFQSGGTFTLVPSTFTWNPLVEPYGTVSGFNFVGDYDYMGIYDPATLAGLTIGRYDGMLNGGNPVLISNYTTLTISTATSVAGFITVCGSTVTINQNLASTGNGNITVCADNLVFAAGKTLSSAGQLHIAPRSSTVTTGIGGATGAFQLPASYFTNNFTDGFANIVIGNDSYTKNINVNAFTIRDDIGFTTSGTLNLNFKPALGNNNIRLSNSLSLSGSSTNYFQTNGTGKIYKTLANGSSYTVPVGNSSYNPVTITNNTGTSDEYSVRVMDAVYQNASNGDIVREDHIARTWDIGKANANGGSGVDLTFYWNQAEEEGTYVNLYLYHYDGSNWIRQTGTTSFDLTSNTLTYSGYTGSFSPFAVVEGSTILPATGLQLAATCNNNNTLLQWSTLTESNTSHFDVQRNIGNSSWATIGTVKASGNSSLLQRYSYTDQQHAATPQYRLLLMDKDGKTSISNTLSVNCNVSQVLLNLPNPVGNSIRFSKLPAGKMYQVNVFTNNGQLLFKGNITNGTVISTAAWLPGVYQLQITDVNGTTQQQKLLKQ